MYVEKMNAEIVLILKIFDLPAFTRRHDLKRHQASVHDDYHYVCGVCGLMYKSRKTLTNHEIIHQVRCCVFFLLFAIDCDICKQTEFFITYFTVE